MNAIRPAPLTLPVVPGVTLSGRYLLGDPSGESRGDCLDAVPVPGGRVGMFVADVVGLDGPADLAAEHVRAILRERLASGAGLAAAMGTLDHYAENHPQLLATTVCAAILRTSDGEFEWAAAGHPPPLRWGANSAPTFLSGVPGQPLGTGGGVTTQTDRVSGDELVALYTDGLVASDGRGLDDGSRMFADAAVRSLAATSKVAPARRGDEICDRVMQDLTTARRPSDDAAILLSVRTPRPEPLSLRVVAEPEQLAPLRHQINSWLDGLGVSLVDHVGLGHAVVELAANVIAHAYFARPDLPPGQQVILLDAHLEEDGWVCITVSDRGRWREQQSSGRGLMMAAGLADRMQLDRTEAGTRVQLAQRLSRPVPVLQRVPQKSVRQVLDESAELQLDVGVGQLVATGPVDDLSVEMFHTALGRATRSGTVDSEIDLGGLTHLSSSGVQAIFEFVSRSGRFGAKLTLRAGEQSPAAQILRVVGLAVDDPPGQG